nr:MAG TPA: hypothetical protein [Caudoviricetes sp.]
MTSFLLYGFPYLQFSVYLVFLTCQRFSENIIQFSCFFIRFSLYYI